MIDRAADAENQAEVNALFTDIDIIEASADESELETAKIHTRYPF